MENMTAVEATTRWHNYTAYRAECYRLQCLPTGYGVWEASGMPSTLLKDRGLAGFSGMNNPSAERKATPIFSGVLKYFPDALAAVARLSKAGNDKHNPGEPLHWSRGKSADHGDCLVRHQMEFEQMDAETGELHATAVAWRALAQLQLLEEQRKK